MTLSTEFSNHHLDENGQPEDIYGDVPNDARLIKEQLRARKEEHDARTDGTSNS